MSEKTEEQQPVAGSAPASVLAVRAVSAWRLRDERRAVVSGTLGRVEWLAKGRVISARTSASAR